MRTSDGAMFRHSNILALFLLIPTHKPTHRSLGDGGVRQNGVTCTSLYKRQNGTHRHMLDLENLSEMTHLQSLPSFEINKRFRWPRCQLKARNMRNAAVVILFSSYYLVSLIFLLTTAVFQNTWNLYFMFPAVKTNYYFFCNFTSVGNSAKSYEHFTLLSCRCRTFFGTYSGHTMYLDSNGRYIWL